MREGGGDPQRVADLFAQALEQPAEERQAFLDSCCQGSPALRAEVKSLLAAHEHAGTFLEGLDAERGGELFQAAADSELAGQLVGPYRLLRELGRGGMGVVYLAERAEGGFEQRAAVKLIKRGMDSEAVLCRFLRERQILAGLEHPNVARLIDGGVSAGGQPYFAMEYVDGEPLTRYCDSRRLGIEARLRLFEDACRAVQAAHARLIVHRDLKPSNMLVTSAGQLKLLDFGVAKLLAEHEGATALTQAGVRVLTPDYAAPEQVRGEPVTTASDVYALGVVLYELLTGCTPSGVERRGAEAGARAACDLEPEPPSAVAARRARASGSGSAAPTPTADEVAQARRLTPERLASRLRGDLEAIVLKALRKEPERRYVSTEALAADLRRHLDGRPVEARRGSRGYRAAKFVRRHRIAVAAGSAAAVSILLGLAASLWQARVAAHERDRAEKKAAEAQAVADFLVNLFHDAEPEREAGGQATARQLVDRGAAHLEQELRDQPLTRARLLETIASVYQQLRLLGPAAMRMEEALALREREQGRAHPDLLTPLMGLAAIHFRATRYDQAHAVLERARRLAEATRGPEAPETAHCLVQLGNLHLVRQSWVEAERSYRTALVIQERLHGRDSLEVATTLNNLGVALNDQGRREEAEAIQSRALAIRQRAMGDEHPSVGQSLVNLARIALGDGDAVRAEPLLERGLAIHERAYGHTHPAVAEALGLLAEARTLMKRPAEAESAWREALRIRLVTLGAEHPETAIARLELALLLAREAPTDEAMLLAAESLAVLDKAEGAVPADLLRARAAVVMLRLRRGDLEAALALVGPPGASSPRSPTDALETFAKGLEAEGLRADAERIRAAARSSARVP